MFCQLCKNKEPCAEGKRLREEVRMWAEATKRSSTPAYGERYKKAIESYRNHGGDNVAGKKSRQNT